MRDDELEIESTELLPELNGFESDFEEEDVEEFDDSLFSAETDLEFDEEKGRSQRLARRRPLPAQFPNRPRRPSPSGAVRPVFGRRVAGQEAALCTCSPKETDYIRWVQSSLNQIIGQNLLVTGVMNRATRAALRDFQKREGLSVDGIAGPETKKALVDWKRREPKNIAQESEFEYSGALDISDELETRESFWRLRPPVRYQGDRYICWAAAISSWSIVTKGVRKFPTTESVLDHFRPTGAMNADDSLILPDGMEKVRRLFGLKGKKFEGGGSLSAINIGPLLKHSHLLVAFRRPDATFYHFVVVYGVDRFRICYMDPELNPAAPVLDKTGKNRVCVRISDFGADATEFSVYWKE